MSSCIKESKAVDDYVAFILIRSRFGGPKKPQTTLHTDEKRKRRDPRFDAPPLKPLVEETDLSSGPDVCPAASASTLNTSPSQCESGGDSSPSSPLKSSYPYKVFPVLNEVETVETASQTSQSSAYFSLTSTLGSVTELSDSASTDSFSEHDVRNGIRTHLEHHFRKVPGKHRPAGLGQRKYFSQPLLRKMQRPFSAGSERTTHAINEPSNPPSQVSSLENIFDSSSKVSVLNAESDRNDMCYSEASRYKLGSFVSRQLSMMSSCNKLIPQDKHTEPNVTDKRFTPQNNAVEDIKKVGIICRPVSVREISNPQFAKLIAVEEKKPVKRPEPILNSSTNSIWVRAQQKYQLMRQRSMDSISSTTNTQETNTGEEQTGLSLIQKRACVFGGMKK